jgi:hypothetical protein
VAFGFLGFLLFSLERRNELSFFLKERGSIGQDNCTAATSFIVGFAIGLLEHLDDANIRACMTNESPESDRLSRWPIWRKLSVDSLMM